MKREHVFVGRLLKRQLCTTRHCGCVHTRVRNDCCQPTPSHPGPILFHSPANSGRSLLSSIIHHQRDAFLRLENKKKFSPIQFNPVWSRAHLLVCVKQVVFVVCCLNLFSCNCIAPKGPHVTPFRGSRAKKKSPLANCCSSLTFCTPTFYLILRASSTD